jgi:acyl-CoA thioester hydrolase
VSQEFRHRTSLQVRFRDIDAFGHVNNAVVLTYAEQARIEYLQAVLAFDRIERQSLILARVELDYRSPILLGEEVTVDTRVDWVGRSSFGMSHRITAGADARLAGDVSTVLVTYDYAVARPMAVPDDWRERMTAFEGRSLDRPQTDVNRPVTAGSPG